MSIESVMPSNHLISVIPFSSFQSFPASGSFPMSQFFASDDQSIRASASASVLPMNIQDWFPLGWTGWISMQSKGLSRVFSQHHSSKASITQWSVFFMGQLSHLCITIGKIIALTRWTFVSKVMSLLFNMLSRLIIAFLIRSKHLLISWLQSPSPVILEPKKVKCHCFHCFSLYLPGWWDWMSWPLFFECWVQIKTVKGLPSDSVVKNLPANAGETGSIPNVERSCMLQSN